ncbi:MAG: patatin-like phospholipase family protein, partial [Alphaproteobacteria bacterium]
KDMAQVYTGENWETFGELKIASTLRNGLGVANSELLASVIRRYAPLEVLNQIGLQHMRGRRLQVGTTNIESGRQVIWDIGEIALSNRPDRLELFHKVLLASAAIPGVFPPSEFRVTVDGATYREIHVDGGVSSQVFTYPAAISQSQRPNQRHLNSNLRLWVIRNGKLSPTFAKSDGGLTDVSAKALGILTRTQGIGDLYRIHNQAQRDKADFNLVYIPDNFNEPLDKRFARSYMNSLFNVGLWLGRQNFRWAKFPPAY